ncbi:MAG: efflux RND transporter periplasmic adaptor subunit [Anaerolineales bacterium]
MKKYRPWIILAVVLIVVVIGWVAVRNMRAMSQNSEYQTVVVERGTLTATIGATGTVRANQTANLVWQTSGTVLEVLVRPGDQVEAGQVLATLDPATLPQNLILAQADLVSAQRALESLQISGTAAAQAELAYYQALDARDAAQTRYDILVSTYGENSTARPLLQARANLALAEARLADAEREYERLRNGPDPDDIAAAEARVRAAEAALRAGQITAPFAGTVTNVIPMPGDLVSPGLAAFRIDDLSRLLIDVQLSEVDINSVEVGQAVVVTLDAAVGQEYHGRVTQVARAGTVAAGTVNFAVTVELTDPDARIRPGMTAAVTITVRQLEDVLLVPNRAVRLVEGQRVVYVIRPDGIERVAITLGASSDLMSEVVAGDLQAGDTLILNPPAEFGQNGPPFMNR